MKIHQTIEFSEWLTKQNQKIKRLITFRLEFISDGHWGNFKRFDGLIEFRWTNGLRLYAFYYGDDVIIITIGGTKNGQKFDIKKAKKIKKEFDDGIRSLHF